MKKLNRNEVKELSNKGHYTKGYVFYELEDGSILEFKKPEIERTLYYNDEYDGPINKDGSNKKEAFISYNMERFHNVAREKMEGFSSEFLDKPMLCENYGGMYGNICYVAWYGFSGQEDSRDKKHFVRYITEREIKEIADIIDEIGENFKKRLNTYFKRYENKIHQHGYWAMR